MPAYIISDVEIRDPAAFAIYRERAAASIRSFGGRYLVRGGAIDVLEGRRHPSALVIVEFPNVAAARLWYASAEYAAALEIRDEALSRSLILVDGVAQADETSRLSLRKVNLRDDDGQQERQAVDDGDPDVAFPTLS